MQSNLSQDRRQYFFWKPVDNYLPEMEFQKALPNPDYLTSFYLDLQDNITQIRQAKAVKQ
jgi:hypothetical protein